MNADWERGYAAGYAAGRAAMDMLGHSAPLAREITSQTPKAKKTRKVSAYSRRYGAEYKRLKRKHPRMKFGALSKKAHAATRKAMK